MINAQRRSDAPSSLARRVDYNKEDVLNALHEDFFGKCYLCENKLTKGAIEVDHRVQVNADDAREFDWSNLFPACRYCNGRRRRTYPEAGLLDPDKHDVERRIRQAALIEAVELRCRFEAADSDDEAATNTADELQHLHSRDSASTDHSRIAAGDLLDAIQDYWIETVYPLEIKILRARRRDETPSALDVGAFQRAVGRDAPYTMLTRSLVSSELADLLDP